MSDNSPPSSSSGSDASSTSSAPKTKTVTAIQPETAKDLESLGKS